MDHVARFQRVSVFPTSFLIGPRKNKPLYHFPCPLEDEKAASQVSGDILTADLIALTFIHVHSTSAKSHGNLDRSTHDRHPELLACSQTTQAPTIPRWTQRLHGLGPVGLQCMTGCTFSTPGAHNALETAICRTGEPRM